jgi:plastocyanin
MKLKALKPLLFTIIILTVIFSYLNYIISIQPEETEELPPEIEEKEYIIEELPEEEPKQIPTPVEPEPDEPKEVRISIDSGSFDPKEITIPVGTTVTWVNNDRRPHTVADSPPNREFYGERIAPGETYSFTFTKEGVYDYFDVVFFQVKGKITVESSAYPITGSAILKQGSPKLAGITILLLLGVIVAFIVSREKIVRKVKIIK